MADPREEAIRQELLRNPRATYAELCVKYRISGHAISRIRKELGIGGGCALSKSTAAADRSTISTSGASASRPSGIPSGCGSR